MPFRVVEVLQAALKHGYTYISIYDGDRESRCTPALRSAACDTECSVISHTPRQYIPLDSSLGPKIKVSRRVIASADHLNDRLCRLPQHVNKQNLRP